MLRLAGGGLVLGVVDAVREARLVGRTDARDLDFDVVTDNCGLDFGRTAATFFRFIMVPLVFGADEGVLLVGAGAEEAPGTESPNFFGGSDGTRDNSGPVGSTVGEARGPQFDVGGTPASVKNW